MDDKPTIPEEGHRRLENRGTQCLNCGHSLEISDRYCSACGQANKDKKLSVKDFFDEFFSSVLSYDSRLLRTLSSLLFRPGTITREYIQGKRKSYTNPFRFLLSLAILYFLMVNYGGNYSRLDRYGMADDGDLMERLEDLQVNFGNGADSQEVSQVLDSLDQQERLQRAIRESRERDSAILADPIPFFRELEDSSFNGRVFGKQKLFVVLIPGDTLYDATDALEKYELEDTFENNLAYNFADGVTQLRRRPGSFVSSMISKLPFAIFFFLPVFAIFIWLVYIRKNHTYTDHLIFGFHNTSRLLILLIIGYLIDAVFDVQSNWVFITIFLIYLFAAMRKFYGQNVFKTLVKYLFLNVIFFILAIFGTVLLFAGNIIV